MGVDIDWVALKRARHIFRAAPWLWLLRADVDALPFSASFGLILVRHPDIDRRGDAWRQALTGLPRLLTTPGFVLVTTYSVAEIEAARGWIYSTDLTPFPILEDRLTGSGPTGRDRLALAWRKER